MKNNGGGIDNINSEMALANISGNVWRNIK